MTDCQNRHCHHCPDPTLHVVAAAPLRPLADLLRAAIEVKVDLGFLVFHGYLPRVRAARFDALSAAVRALVEPAQ